MLSHQTATGTAGQPLHIVILTHPRFLPSQSMPRFARLLVDGLRARGHAVETLTAKARMARLAGGRPGLLKWLGYLDRFLIFPVEFLLQRKRFGPSTLFVFSDQALGPWIRLVSGRPHVIHCHDFLALRSALGELPQNPTGWSGRRYQALIRWGFSKGRNFISVSDATREQLGRFLDQPADLSVTVYNGLNYAFDPMPLDSRLTLLELLTGKVPDQGFLLHVGGNQWYKNRAGVIALYAQYAVQNDAPLPLWMIGAPPPPQLLAAAQAIPSGSIRFITGASDAQVHAAYSHATALLYPSYAEGFGWPIAEAMACGCPVITSDSAPMTEVGGRAALYIPTPRPGALPAWAQQAARTVSETVALSPAQRQQRQSLGLQQAAQFDQSRVIPAYEAVYRQVLAAEAAAVETVSISGADK